MKAHSEPEFLLSDYRPPAYLVETVDMRFELDRAETLVHTKLTIRRAEETTADTPLFLDGHDLKLLSIQLDGAPVNEEMISVSKEGMIIRGLPRQAVFTLETSVRIHPEKNTELMGLYATSNNFCTQCEAEGFRRITFFPDRPDILSVYTVRLEADADAVPLLLSNGNNVEAGALGDGKHYVVWHDPHPKPSYLFAVFAGDLAKVTDNFTTASGRDVVLEIYVEHGKQARALYAMDALKRSMKWDEERFGREYDLDIFMIVAVSDFNMGAMENKGLNIFNDKYVLADPETATDADYANIESIIAHEYFHNWTGNRITCRDWFQLCLKEGLTVYRDHEFSSEMRSRSVKRVADVRALRAHQFPEDAGPLAHPVRPRKYREINNFYTATVYEKGAELVRMLQTILGADGFRAGIDLYFDRHDGDAATIEQFLTCFADATGTDLVQFAQWYDFAGTPNVAISSDYDARAKKFTVTASQSLRSGVKQTGTGPMHIPLSFALLGSDGSHLSWAHVKGGDVQDGVIHLRERRQTFTFDGVAEEPVLSALRGFSAPVTRIPEASAQQAAFLARHDDDDFNRWDSVNGLFVRAMTEASTAQQEQRRYALDKNFTQIMAELAADKQLEPAFRALCLTPPTVSEIAREIGRAIDPLGIHIGREHVLDTISAQCADAFDVVFKSVNTHEAFEPSADQAGKRSLKAILLAYLARGAEGVTLGKALFDDADNMTDRLASLTVLAHQFPDHDETKAALDAFYERYRDEPIVLDKWISVQATIPSEDTLERVEDLASSPVFSLNNPNRARALLGAFSSGNPVAFNQANGDGYAFFCDHIVRLDAINPQVSARLMTAMRSWNELEPVRRNAAHEALEALASRPNLSRDLRDIVGRMLSA